MFETRHLRIKNFLLDIENEWRKYYINNITKSFYTPSISWSYISENINVTMDTVLENPGLPWNYSHLSANRNINYQIVKKHSDKPWDYKTLSLNPNITFDDVLSDISKQWDWNSLSVNKTLTLDIVRRYFHKFNPILLIHNKIITYEIIISNPQLPWKLNEIPYKTNLTFDNILEMYYVMKIKFTNEHWIFISEQKYINLEIVQQYRNLPWNFISFTRNPNITYEIMKQNKDIPWSYKNYIYNSNCDFNFVVQHRELDLDWEYISEHLVTLEQFLNHPDLPFCHNSIQMNKNITFDDLWKIPFIKHNMNYISLNRSITLKDIRENRGYLWDWFWLSSSYFSAEKKEFIEKKKREWMAVYKIQQFYLERKLNPNYRIGRQNINKMYQELF